MSDANGFGRDTADLPDEERPVDEPAEPDPEAVADARYYRPTELGAEAPVKQRWERIRAIIRGHS